MALVVKNNMSALSTLNIMSKNNKNLAASLQKVSSGQKINSAADDPAGYAISQRMQTQIRSLNQDNENAANGQNMLKTAEGTVSSTVDILKTLKEKVLDAANDTNTTYDRDTIQDYLNQSVDQINDNANVTYNGKLLVDGSMNQSGTAATVTYTNESLATGTAFSSSLTALLDRNGNSLNILGADQVTISYVSNGKTMTTSFSASGATLQSIFDAASQADGASVTGFGDSNYLTGIGSGSFIGLNAQGVSVYTADGSSVLSVASTNSGVGGNISGFTISITGTDGNVKKSVNTVLDAWNEQINAQDKSNDNSITLQVGTKANQSIRVGLGDMRARALGLQGVSADGSVQNLDVSTRGNANAAVNVLDNAVQKALKEQTQIGSVESRLDYTQDNLTTASQNVQASESTITDANMAQEMTEYTKNNILMQASQAMLAQANSGSQNILQLLQ
ncbi:flagellin N-terminal helical domain-containing protein [Pectinatus frisingensis]|uniref:flagellin N-terminal helical domain-containing protein n=1 Tax=Pectinatus frisingensis TaxID=865 RepID=UPI0018C7ABD9|nr:flagellin [Pectinatus frisingensis]